MHIYSAAAFTTGIHSMSAYYAKMNERERAVLNGNQYSLESYHFVQLESRVREMRRDKARVFLDSGAFSAMTTGAHIDLDGYCQYIHDNADLITYFSVLDGIGDPQLTYENQCAMESAGLTPLPCFHYGEDERYLEYYLERYPYITLGGLVPIGKPSQRVWLDRIWGKYLTHPDGTAKTKVHGFGVTSVELMRRYPWYSVDSSSWLAGGNMGNAQLPKLGMFPVSVNHPTRRQRDRHLDTLTPEKRAFVVEYIESRGFDLTRVQNYYFTRWMLNMNSFHEIESQINSEGVRFFAQPSILDG